MKILFITFALSVATLIAIPVHAQSTDEAAVRKTVGDSRVAFEKRDLNTFATYFVNSPDLYYQVSTADHQVYLAHGFENMKKMVGGYIKDNPTPAKTDRFKTSDLHIRINGNMAFMAANNMDPDTKENGQEFFVLEKMGGVWKISTLTVQYYETGKRTEIK